MATLAHRFVLGAARFLFYTPLKAYFHFSFEGLDNLPERSGAILCANHASFLDPIVLQAPFRQPIHYLMSAEFYNAPLFRWVSRAFEAIPVDGDSANFAAITAAGEVLEAGEVVGVFPEGGISRDGRLKSFRSGAAVLAMRHGVPLVPAWIEGTYEALPRKARRIRRSRVSLHVGDPIAVARSETNSRGGEAVAALTARLRAAVASLAPSPDRVDVAD